MSTINQMLRALDKRGASGAGTGKQVAPPAAQATARPEANAPARAYAQARMLHPRTRLSRGVLLLGGIAALLPIAWAAAHFESAGTTKPAHPEVAAAREPARALTAIETNGQTNAQTSAQTSAQTNAQATATINVPMTAATGVSATAPTTSRTPAVEPAPVLTLSTSAVFTNAATPTSAGPASTAATAPMAARLANAAMPARAPASQGAESPRALRAAALAGQSNSDDTGGAEALASARGQRHNRPAAESQDTRLALASPTVPKEDARIERHPTDARDDLTRAGEAMSVGRTSDAIVLLRKAIAAEPDNERARLALLSLLAERGRDETWRAALVDSARASPRRFGLAAAQGLAESGRYEQGLAVLQGLPEAVHDTRYFSALGAMHQQLRQHADAVAAFDAALNIAPGNSPQVPSLLVAQALSMQSLGQQTEARRNLERVRQMPEAAADVREFAARELAQRP